MTTPVLDLIAGAAPVRPTGGPEISALFLLIPAALLVLVGVWGLRNAEAQAKAAPLDARTQEKRRKTYQRGSITCLVVAAAFVVLAILSFLTVGSPR